MMNEALAQSGLYQPVGSEQTAVTGEGRYRQAQHDEALSTLHRERAVQRITRRHRRQPVVERLRHVLGA